MPDKNEPPDTIIDIGPPILPETPEIPAPRDLEWLEPIEPPRQPAPADRREV